MYKHIKLRGENANADQIAEVEKLLFFAAVSMSDDNAKMQAAMFIDTMVAFESHAGTLHVLLKGGRPLAFAFVLDKYNEADGAYHIHLVSVFKAHRGKGLGRMIVQRVLDDLCGQPVSLEVQPVSVEFFKKMGFSIKHVLLEWGYIPMYANGDGAKDRFKKLQYTTEVAKRYEVRFDNVAAGLGY
jgi:ribosomal protein S18 acetylase RimI-like enzyme